MANESTSEITPVRVRDMPWESMRLLLREIGPEIARLAHRGDRFAIKVMARYQDAYEHPTDAKANQELRVAVEDYINRDLRVAEQVELAGKFGHRLEEKEPGVRVFVPESLSKQ